MSQTTYQSPFTWRYGSEEMRRIFSEQRKYEIWRTIWVALAEAQHRAGLVSQDELEDLEKNQHALDIDRILELEKETKHDVVAAIKEFAEKAQTGGGKIHLGATSMDIVDNADCIRTNEALALVEQKLNTVIQLLAEKADHYAEFPCMAYTHIQPAEPTTLGYRFAFYLQDLSIDHDGLQFLKNSLRAKGLKGAVGTAAGYHVLLEGTPVTAADLETQVMDKLGLQAVDISTQVAPRKYDYLVLSSLAGISSSLAKFAADLRILQSPAYGEVSEPFGKTQVGSSAMPFKRNPIHAEKICSLARYLTQLPPVALENASHSYLERTLDDSANKRITMAESFLAVDEIITTTIQLLKGLHVHERQIQRNLETYGPFAASEAILMKAVTKGANRQNLHETLRTIAMAAWKDVQAGKENSMKKRIQSDSTIQKYLDPDELEVLFDVKTHTGTAAARVKKIIKANNTRVEMTQ